MQNLKKTSKKANIISFLEKLNENVMDFGLERIKKVLKLYLLNKHQNLKVIHIAGTNGKGSTSNFIQTILYKNLKSKDNNKVLTKESAKILTENIRQFVEVEKKDEVLKENVNIKNENADLKADIKTNFFDSLLRKRGEASKIGLFTSPHIYSINERIKINNENISDENLEKYIIDLKNFLKKNDSIKLTYFEILTVLAIKYFIDEHVDISVFECGLGGRLDSTNVFAKPLLTIITNISLEHQKFLGNTTQDILKEKMGIIKKHTPLITGVEQKKLQKILIDESLDKKKPFELFILNRDFFIKKQKDGNYIFQDDKKFLIKNISLKIKGTHQYKNLALAIETINILMRKYNFEFENHKKILETINNFTLQGRLEFIAFDSLKNNLNTNLLLDVGHNLVGIETFIEYLKKIKKNYKNIAIVFGILNDKNYKKILKKILKISNIIYLTEPESARALKLKIIEKYLKDIGESEKIKLVSKNIIEIKNDIKNSFEKNDLVCVVGSFYLIKKFKLSS
ncbi:MAG: hypothetical protein LBF97_04160 [Elusimicrobiota bacterium]|jgi:dihydrofolate synthase/folylpolyglutamate synthase|nr:hypothetical protein [Elusimicrobiota bacterium]